MGSLELEVNAVEATSFKTGDKVMAEGDGVIVLVDYTTGAKVPVSGEMRALLEARMIVR